MTDLDPLLDRLAAFEPTTLPVLSLYLNTSSDQVTTEVCDGRPSDVEREGVTFGGGRFCPWTARVISIQED